ncbi:MAG: hypothetical protein JEZ07_18590 [Phycisphaerae bacterium]|nr:hypothetical protein [Phycisphaerae bacterium]
MKLIDYPGHPIAISIIAIAAILLLLAYRSKNIKDANLWRMPLWFLQMAAIVVLLLIIWNPSRPEYEKKTAKNTVQVFFDTSESMSVSEDQKQNRLDRAIETFENNFAINDPESPNYQIFGFDRQAYRCDSLKSLSRWGATSTLGPVSRHLNRIASQSNSRDDQTRVVGAIIFTDGQVNDKSINNYVSQNDNKIDVVIVGLGKEQQRPDIAIKSIKAPNTVQIDTGYNVSVDIQCSKLIPQNIRLELRKDNKLIGFKDISASGLENDSKVLFPVAADTLGGHVLEVSVKAIENEINLANNVSRTMVNVVETSKLNVLLYSEVASIDFGKIRSALVRDKRIQLDVGLNAIKVATTNRKMKELDGHISLPEDIAGFSKYDIIILGPCDYRKLTEAQTKGLYRFVVERGGGLVILGDRNGYTVENCPSEDIQVLLPVEFDSLRNNGYAQLADAKLTLEGIESKIMPRKINDSFIYTDDNFPAKIKPIITNIRKKPAATTIVTANNSPVVCLQRIGRGQVCFLNTYGFYRWYREDLDGGLLREFFSGLTSYMGQVSNSQAGVELFAKRKADEPARIVFEALVYDRAFESVSDATVLLTLGDIAVTMQPSSPGHYSCILDNIKDQALIAKVEAQKDGVFLGEKILTTTLTMPKTEMDNVDPDRQFLQRLARKIGGEYLDIENIDAKLAKQFDPVTEIEAISSMESVWPGWTLFASLCGILTLYWFIRRAKGLM